MEKGRAMEKNRVKAKMEAGEKVIGTFFALDSVPAVEVLANLGYDLIMIDTEHGPFDVETAEKFVIASEAAGITPFVRIKDTTRGSVLKMLDIGARGLLVPYIKTPEQVRDVISYGKYRPLGDRGFGPGRAAGYATDPKIINNIEEYFSFANSENLVIPQCETVEALERIEEIADIDGVAGIFIGPFDLSISMGIPRKFGEPVFIEAMKKVVKACHDRGKFAWILAGTPEDAEYKFSLGFDGVLNMDLSLFRAGAAAFIDGTKERL